MSEISPNQRIIVRFAIFAVACLYENLPIFQRRVKEKGPLGDSHGVCFLIGEEMCFLNDSYFGLKLKLAIHDNRCIYTCIFIQ